MKNRYPNLSFDKYQTTNYVFFVMKKSEMKESLK